MHRRTRSSPRAGRRASAASTRRCTSSSCPSRARTVSKAITAWARRSAVPGERGGRRQLAKRGAGNKAAERTEKKSSGDGIKDDRHRSSIPSPGERGGRRQLAKRGAGNKAAERTEKKSSGDGIKD